MPKKKSKAEMMRQCVAWNNANPHGTEVIVTKDMGEEVHTKTRGEAYVCASGYPVIFLEGISGYYLLDRVRRAEEAKS
jgi:hypothetical protein